MCLLLGTWLAIQACALTENPTGDPLVCRPALTPLRYTIQGNVSYYYGHIISYIIMFTYIYMCHSPFSPHSSGLRLEVSSSRKPSLNTINQGWVRTFLWTNSTLCTYIDHTCITPIVTICLPMAVSSLRTWAVASPLYSWCPSQCWAQSKPSGNTCWMND